ncbi:hypothetical protein ACHAXT_003347 [Thalassiosira profunda]
MPSPAKRYSPAPRTSPRRAAAAGRTSSLASAGRDPAARRRIMDHDDDDEANDQNNEGPKTNDPTLVGKRTGVALPPRGAIPIGQDGLEDADAFFAAAKSPAGGLRSPDGSHGHGSPSKAYGRRAEKARARDKQDEERRLRREALEAEGRKNAARGPEILHQNDDEEGEGGARGKKRTPTQTPKNPGWSNRLLHQAMGVPTEDSPQYTVLSKVSTAAPSTQGSLNTIATEARHARRGEQSQDQLERLARREGASPAVGEEEKEEPAFDGPVDPPEEAAAASGGGKARGVDPEEREDAPDQLENSLEEVVNRSYDDDDGEGGGMRLATQDDADFGGGGGFDDEFGNHDDDEEEEVDAVSNAASRKSGTSKARSKDEDDDDESPVPPKKKRGPGRPKKADQKGEVTPTSVLRTKASKKKKQQKNKVNFQTPRGESVGLPQGNRAYEAVPVSDYKEDYPPGQEPRTPGGSVLRRSRRAKFQPLQYWKNEKVIYEAQNEAGMLGEAMGDMPVVAGVLTALPTPYKEAKRRAPVEKKKKGGKRGRDGDDSDDDARPSKTPFDSKALRKRHAIDDGESGAVWSETLEAATDIKIVSRLDNRSFSKLPLSTGRKKRESKVVGFASQAFHVPTDDDDLFPGYISGNVVLPPRGIKDAEGVGLCSQVFNVADCQPGSLEFALADPAGQDGEFDPKTAQRFLLSKGDMFQIPPGNVYRIENHSKTERANLFWTIVKCTSRAEQEDSEEEED